MNSAFGGARLLLDLAVVVGVSEEITVDRTNSRDDRSPRRNRSGRRRERLPRKGRAACGRDRRRPAGHAVAQRILPSAPRPPRSEVCQSCDFPERRRPRAERSTPLHPESSCVFFARRACCAKCGRGNAIQQPPGGPPFSPSTRSGYRPGRETGVRASCSRSDWPGDPPPTSATRWR